MSDIALRGVYFDGRTAAGRGVEVRVAGRDLTVVTEDGTLDTVTLDRERVSERLAQAPRIVALDHGASLEVPDPDGRFDRALEAAGVYPSLVERVQRFWPAALASLAGIVVLAIATYVQGVPAAANWLAYRLPDEVMRQLDRRIFARSRLPAARREALTRRFTAAAAVAAPDVPFRIEYRTMRDEPGVNAMALPGGTIVLLDGLVELAEDDDALMGVLAHELGHVAHKHSLRGLLQALGMGALAAVLWGDFSNVIANVPLALGVLRYSRAFERDADDFAVALLKANGISTHPFADFFTTLEEELHKERGGSTPPAFLSTHPSSAERQQRLRDAEN
jgi:Zn-dependent protease with chaperone function